MNSVVIFLLSLLIPIIFFGEKKWAVLSIIFGVLYITQGQYFEIFGIKIYSTRIFEIVGFMRVVCRKEFHISEINKLDKVFIFLFFYTTVVFLINQSDGKTYQIGLAIDAILFYFTFRGLIENLDDFKTLVSSFTYLLLPYFVLVAYESYYKVNLFNFQGSGVEGVYRIFRGDRIRCWGSFRHPILLGSLGSSFLPFYIGQYFDSAKRKNAILGCFLCLGIVYFSASGGPLATIGVTVLGWFLWILRKQMAMVRVSFVGFIILLAIYMKAPIWFIFARISSITGGTGDHRSYLLDATIKNFDKWVVAGLPIKETSEWLPQAIATTGGADITNQYIAYALSGGLGAVIIVICLLVVSFKVIGKSIVLLSKNKNNNEEKSSVYIVWGIGVALAVHSFNWLGVTYFDQFKVFWIMNIAIISCLPPLKK